MKGDMPETIFSKILRNEIPCHKVYEDQDVLAFLDISPLSPGHTLVIPKEPAETLDQLSDASAAAIGRVLPRICRAVMKATATSAYNVLENNGSRAHQAVRHVHFHVIPKPDETSGLGLSWAPKSLDATAAAELARRIAGELG
jgi:histidine triad (HIT) family protein